MQQGIEILKEVPDRGTCPRVDVSGVILVINIKPLIILHRV